jgi:hypothetical protein
MSIMVAKEPKLMRKSKKNKNIRIIYIGNCMKVIPIVPFDVVRGK